MGDFLGDSPSSFLWTPQLRESRLLGENMEIPLSVIKWIDKKGTEHTSKKTFTTTEEIAEYYKHMRGRVDGLMVVVPLNDDKQTKLC